MSANSRRDELKVKYANAIEMMLSKKSKNASRRDEIRVRYTNVHNLVPSRYNNYPIVDIEKLACFIKLSGEITPLTLRPLPDGRFTILSGHRRTQAVLYLLEQDSTFSPMIPYIEPRQNNELDYLDEDDREKLAICLPNEGQRRSLSPAETAEILKDLRPVIKKIYEHGKEDGTINTHFRKFFADFLDMSEAKIQRGEAYSKLSDKLRAEVDAGIIAPTVAALLAGNPPDEQDNIISRIRAAGQEITKQSINEFLHPSSPVPAATTPTATEKAHEDEDTEIYSPDDDMPDNDIPDDDQPEAASEFSPEKENYTDCEADATPAVQEECDIKHDIENTTTIAEELPETEPDKPHVSEDNEISCTADDISACLSNDDEAQNLPDTDAEAYDPDSRDTILEKNKEILKDYYDILNTIKSRAELKDYIDMLRRELNVMDNMLDT